MHQYNMKNFGIKIIRNIILSFQMTKELYMRIYYNTLSENVMRNS